MDIILKKVAFITDSGSGKSIAEIEALGCYSVPLQLMADKDSYKEFETISYDKVYEILGENKVMTTSLPAIADIEQLFSQLKEKGYTDIFAVPICSGLSGTINAMYTAANSLELGFDYFDSGTTAVIQLYLLKLAKSLHEKGIDFPQIKEKLMEVVDHANTVLIPDDLMHLARGGRLSSTSAVIGNLIKIKPVLEVNLKTKGRIEVLQKLRTFKRAFQYVIDEMAEEIKDASDHYHIVVAHVDAVEKGQDVLATLKAKFPQATTEFIDLVPTVSCHTGLGCIALQYFKKVD